MSDRADVCTGPGEDGVDICGLPVFRGVAETEKSLCSSHMKQWQRNGKLAPIEKLSPWQRVIEAKEALDDALTSDENEGLGGDEYDDRCEKAERAFRRAVESFGKRNTSPEDAARLAELERAAAAHRKHAEATHAGLAKARAEGKRPGPKGADARKVADVVKQFRRPVVPPLTEAVKRAAKKLRMAERTVWRALRRATDKLPHSDSGRGDASSGGPRSG